MLRMKNKVRGKSFRCVAVRAQRPRDSLYHLRTLTYCCKPVSHRSQQYCLFNDQCLLFQDQRSETLAVSPTAVPPSKVIENTITIPKKHGGHVVRMFTTISKNKKYYGHFKDTSTEFTGVWLMLKKSHDIYYHTTPDLHILTA